MNWLHHDLKYPRLSLTACILGVATLVGIAAAQVPALFLNSIAGTEQVNVVVPATGTVVTSPQIVTVTLNTIRNTTGYQLSSATTGTVVTTTATDNLIFTAAATTVTVDLPPSPSDGALFSLNNGTGSNFSGTITVATTDGSTIANGATAVNLGSAGSQEWQYTAASKTWYRLR